MVFSCAYRYLYHHHANPGTPMKKAKDVFIVMLGVLALIYILNPGAGILEIIPDNLPVIGNIDEAAAGLILISCLRYFGLDFSNLFKKT